MFDSCNSSQVFSVSHCSISGPNRTSQVFSEPVIKQLVLSFREVHFVPCFLVITNWSDRVHPEFSCAETSQRSVPFASSRCSSLSPFALIQFFDNFLQVCSFTQNSSYCFDTPISHSLVRMYQVPSCQQCESQRLRPPSRGFEENRMHFPVEPRQSCLRVERELGVKTQHWRRKDLNRLCFLLDASWDLFAPFQHSFVFFHSFLTDFCLFLLGARRAGCHRSSNQHKCFCAFEFLLLEFLPPFLSPCSRRWQSS